MNGDVTSGDGKIGIRGSNSEYVWGHTKFALSESQEKVSSRPLFVGIRNQGEGSWLGIR